MEVWKLQLWTKTEGVAEICGPEETMRLGFDMVWDSLGQVLEGTGPRSIKLVGFWDDAARSECDLVMSMENVVGARLLKM